MLAVDIINLIAYKFIYRYNCNQNLILLFIICIYRTVLIIFVCCENGAFPLHKDNKKIIFSRSISDIKIGQKSGNPKEDVLHFGGSGMRCISAYFE